VLWQLYCGDGGITDTLLSAGLMLPRRTGMRHGSQCPLSLACPCCLAEEQVFVASLHRESKVLVSYTHHFVRVDLCTNANDSSCCARRSPIRSDPECQTRVEVRRVAEDRRPLHHVCAVELDEFLFSCIEPILHGPHHFASIWVVV
jgi:hypothetical protein